jgi:hypothetical protein
MISLQQSLLIENLLVSRNPRGMQTLQTALKPGYYLRGGIDGRRTDRPTQMTKATAHDPDSLYSEGVPLLIGALPLARYSQS